MALDTILPWQFDLEILVVGWTDLYFILASGKSRSESGEKMPLKIGAEEVGKFSLFKPKFIIVSFDHFVELL